MNGDDAVRGRFARVRSIFDDAIGRPAEARSAFLDHACAGDDALRAEVEALLAHHDATCDFLDAPALDSHPSIFHDEADDAPMLQPGDEIGSYRILRELARGGMGVVYEARQAATRRLAALKFMRLGVGSRAAVRRFSFESQVLARLLHPNIAQVYDAGVHYRGSVREGGDGLPWFAMELVPNARPITVGAAAMGLDIRARLGLFLQACDAVHYGHQRGVIHRDLKPSNILVDDEGRVKVIDFGIAKATDSDVAVTTQRTDLGQLFGTVQYMSPEQCDGNPAEIDLRTDVYSLGVVLYELLAGTLPYDAGSSSLFLAVRTVRETEPRRPSLDEPRLRGDLEAIILKALEKERDRRYASVAALADDLRAYLDGGVVSARGPSVVYRVAKWVERRRWQAAASAAAALALSTLVVAGLVGRFAWQASRARADEAVQRARAEAIAYGARLNAAAAALDVHDVANARRLLGEPRPDDFWEVRHLRSRLEHAIEVFEPSEPGHVGRGVSISPDGRFVAASYHNGAGCMVRVYERGVDRPRLDEYWPADPDCRLTFSPDGRWLVIGRGQGEVQLRRWPPRDPPEPPAARGQGHRHAVTRLAFHPDGSLLASTSIDGTVCLWSVEAVEDRQASLNSRPTDWTPLNQFVAHDWQVSDAAFSLDGRWLATCSYDYSIAIWDVSATLENAYRDGPDAAPVEAARLRGHTDYVQGIAFTPDGRLLASASIDGTVRLWDVQASRGQNDRTGGAGGPGTAPGVLVDVLRGDGAGLYDVIVTPDGSRLVAAGADGGLRYWSLDADALVFGRGLADPWSRAQRRLVGVAHGHTAPVRMLDVSQAGGPIASVDMEGAARLWQPDFVDDRPALAGHSTSVHEVAFSADGRLAVTTSAEGTDGYVIVWDVHDAGSTARLAVGCHDFKAVAWLGTAEEPVLAVGLGDRREGVDGTSALWDLRDPHMPRRVGALEAPGAERFHVVAMAVNADRTRLAATTVDGHVHLWEVEGASATHLAGATPDVGGVIDDIAFVDQEGSWLAVVASGVHNPGPDRPVILWDLATDRQTRLDTGDDGAVMVIAADPQRRLLATGAADGTVRLWRLDGAAPPTPVHVLRGHGGAVRSLAFHPTEPRLFSGSTDCTIKVWDLETGIENVTLRGHLGTITDLAFDPAAQRLASTSSGFEGTDNVARFWETARPSERLRRRAVVAEGWSVARDLLWRATSRSDGHASISNDASLSAEVRAVAMDAFDQLWSAPPFALAFNNRDTREARLALRSGRSADQYRVALQLALERREALGDWPTTLAVLGAAQYRTGDWAGALDTLTQAVGASERAYGQPDPHEVTFLAMTLHRLGRTEEAKQRLEQARRLRAQSTVVWEGDSIALMREAEALIEGDATP